MYYDKCSEELKKQFDLGLPCFLISDIQSGKPTFYLRIEREKCWNFNGYPQDDLRTRSGQITALAPFFGNSWKVSITINVLKFSTLVAL